MLQSFDILDSPEEQAFDDLTRTAAQLLNAPIALISLIDEGRQWFKAHIGLEVRQTPREQAFCDHTIRTPCRPLVVPDARLDERFCRNPLVTGEPHIRFYVGVPLVTATGDALGTLCVIDRQPRHIDPQVIEQLDFLARQVMIRLEERRSEMSSGGLHIESGCASTPWPDGLRA